MNITRIELAGSIKPGHAIPDTFATISRKAGSDEITVELITTAGCRTHHVGADGVDDRDDQYSMAQILQHALDGHRGSNSMVHDYFREIQRFAD